MHNRPNIALYVGLVARFSTNLRENHLMAIKIIMKYLKWTKDYGLYYKKNEKFELRAYTNVDWAGNIDAKKRTSGGEFFLGKRLVTWTSKKQNCISQYIVEAKYFVAVVNCTNIVWIKKLLRGMKEEIIESVILYCDNTIAINISKNLVMHTKKSTLKSSSIIWES